MNRRNHRTGLSLLELLAALAIIGAVSLVIIPRIAGSNDDAEVEACNLNQAEIELQCQLWRRATGSFPAANLSGIGSNSSFFPDGLPTCPVDGSAYTIDTTSGQVVGHSH